MIPLIYFVMFVLMVIFFSPPKDRCYKCGRDCSKKVGYAPGAHCDNCNKIFE